MINLLLLYLLLLLRRFCEKSLFDNSNVIRHNLFWLKKYQYNLAIRNVYIIWFYSMNQSYIKKCLLSKIRVCRIMHTSQEHVLCQIKVVWFPFVIAVRGQATNEYYIWANVQANKNT